MAVCECLVKTGWFVFIKNAAHAGRSHSPMHWTYNTTHVVIPGLPTAFRPHTLIVMSASRRGLPEQQLRPSTSISELISGTAERHSVSRSQNNCTSFIVLRPNCIHMYILCKQDA